MRCFFFFGLSFFPRVCRPPGVSKVFILGGGLFLYLLSPLHVLAQVLINEIYYDNPGSDEGYEFIELINVGDEPKGLGNFVIEFHNGSDEGWKPIWTGGSDDSISPNDLFVVGESLVRPLPDAVINLSIQNGPDALRLLADGTVCDLVGYGNLDDPSSCETKSAEDVPAGFSLSRMPDGKDTDDNSSDFVRAHPSPGGFNIPGIDLSIHLEENFNRRANEGLPLEIPFCIRNSGKMQVPAESFSVEVCDSTELGLEKIDSISSSNGLAPGDSIEFNLSVHLLPGYHWIKLRVKCAGDERAYNNEIESIVLAGELGVLISEIMSYPISDCPQYVEIYNYGEKTIDLYRWKIRDSSHVPSVITESHVLLGPGSYMVLTGDKSELLVCFPLLNEDNVIQVEGSWPRFNHTGSATEADSVIIADGFGFSSDMVAYPAQEPSSRGKSLERVDLFPSSSEHAWFISPGGGTPGFENSVSFENPPPGERIIVGNNPFSPWDGELLTIEIPARENVHRVVASIFDINGVKVADIGSSAVLPAVFVWNGKGTDGYGLHPGVYVLAFEMFLKDGGKSVERVVVGCGRRKKH